MIARERRTQLSIQIHSLIAGIITNDDFDDWLIEHDFCAHRDPREYDDAALGPIVERAYCLYSDMPTYKLIGKRKLDRKTYRDALRWILFLRSDLEYEWPVHFYASRFPDIEWFLHKITFGRYPNLLRPNETFKQWQAHGDFEVWPFLRTSDYAKIKFESCWLNYSAA